jgi:hypothetical protein
MTTCDHCHQEINPGLLLDDAVRFLDHASGVAAGISDDDRNSLGYSRKLGVQRYIRQARECICAAAQALPRSDQ